MQSRSFISLSLNSNVVLVSPFRLQALAKYKILMITRKDLRTFNNIQPSEVGQYIGNYGSISAPLTPDVDVGRINQIFECSNKQNKNTNNNNNKE
jgi:hypothetical protein